MKRINSLQIKNNLTRLTCSRGLVKLTQSVLALLFVGLFAFSSVVYADGFGVNANNSNNGKIDDLLNKVNSQGGNQSGNQNQSHHANKQTSKDPLRDEAFANMSSNLLPLTPEQIKLLHYMFDRTRHAAAQYPGTPPKPTSTSLRVNLSPGAAPPIVRLRQGFVSSLVFVDATGQPWPIQSYNLGNPKDFNISWDQKSNTLVVQSQGSYESGNLAVQLKGLNTPIMITLMPGQHAVDYRVDLRIPKLGPNASSDLAGLPNSESPELMNVLDGVPPSDAKALQIKGAGMNTQAWLVDNRIYLRTDMTIVSPAFLSTMSSSDGTHAYELPATPVILAQSHGKTVTLKIKGL